MKTAILSLYLLSLPVEEVSAIREALGAIESSNDDKALGKSGERSRFQVMPKVWARHTIRRNYTDPDAAWVVVSAIINERSESYRRVMGRWPDHASLYCLWHRPTRFYCDRNKAYGGWDLTGKEKERAQRFASLVEDSLKPKKP